ncbi:MAG: PorT family protein [Bacteroidales bacterium]|nr:PorT family protein [Bacteroidales bacterium]MBN2758231.1 PorT family protein [Bacteroidales bacterium]
MNLYNVKSLIFALILISISIISYSQPIIGIHAGLNAAALNGDKTFDENKLRLGINAYAFIDIPFNYIVSLETGIEYANKGMHFESVIPALGSTNTIKVKYHLDYVVLPVYIKENFTNFYTKIGPYAAYLINSKSSWENTQEKGGIYTVTTGVDETFQDDLRFFDGGISIGLGYIHYLEKKYRKRAGRSRRRKSAIMQFDLKYDIGFFNLDATGRNDDFKLKNRVFTIGISFTSVLD